MALIDRGLVSGLLALAASGLAVAGCAGSGAASGSARPSIGASISAASGQRVAAMEPAPELAPELALAGHGEAGLELPVAVPTLGLDPAGVLTRIAFGSCNGQEQDQAYWQAIAGQAPQAFVFLGDNVYGDTGWDGGADLGSFVAAYRKQAGSAPFNTLRQSTAMLAIWDDHDFGPNDSGASFAHRAHSQRLFKTFWNAPPEMRARDGIYSALSVGPDGQRVQIILLDTRYFRSDLVELPEDERRGLGRWGQNGDPAATILGEAQWQWLAGELARPADLRVVVSSIQVLSEAHDFESWSRFPRERERLLAMLGDRAGGGLIILSGDRHTAGFYEAPAAGAGGPLREFTSSSLNRPQGRGMAELDLREPDPLRLGSLYGQSNFGTMAIDWAQRRLLLEIRDESGAVLSAWNPAF